MTIKRRAVERTNGNVLAEFHGVYRSLPGFRGVDIGFRWRGGWMGSEHCLRLHLEAPSKRRSSNQKIPSSFAGLPVDVVATNYDANGPSGVQAPVGGHLAAGVTCGDATAVGQVSVMVAKRETGALGFLTSWSAGSCASNDISAPVHAVLSKDGVGPQIGSLSEKMLDRHGAAALVSIEGSQPWLPIVRPSNLAITSLTLPRLGENYRVGETYAKVDGAGIYRITHEVAPGVFKEIDIEGNRIIAGCDVASGSLIYDDQTAAGVGMVCGTGKRVGRFSTYIMCNLPRVFAGLGLRLASFDDLTDRPMGQARPYQRPAYGVGMSSFMADPREAGPTGPATVCVQENNRLDVPTVIWPMLIAALRNQGHKATRITDRVEKLDPKGGFLGIIANSVNGAPDFTRLGLRPIGPQDLVGSATFDQICERLNDILDAGR